jgi:hypothetical protein
MQFSSAEDYPYNTIFIDETYKIKKDTFMYVIVSSDGIHAALIDRSTRAHWVKEEIFDKKQDRKCVNAACPKELARFVKLRG